MLQRPLLVPLLLVAAFTLACAGEQTPVQLFDEHQATIQARLDAVRSCAGALDQLAPLTADTLAGSFEPPVAFPNDSNIAYVEPWNALAFYVEDVRSDDGTGQVWWRHQTAYDWLELHSAGAGMIRISELRNQRMDDLGPFVQRLETLEYVLLSRTVAVQWPKGAGAGYTEGWALGESHLYRVDGCEHLGGLRIAAGTPPVVLVTYDKDAPYIDVTGPAVHAMGNAMTDDMAQKIEQIIPGNAPYRRR